MQQQPAERYSVAKFREGLYRFAMRGRYVDPYKRVSSREHISAYDNKEENTVRLLNTKPSWRRSLRHVLVASLSSFIFGYHLGVVNETLESISIDLGFRGSTMAEGLVVSTCLGGVFVGSLFCGWIVDGVGRRRGFQLCALPMIIGASMSAMAKSLWGMLLGRLFVGTGMGLGSTITALYVAENLEFIGLTFSCKGHFWELNSDCNMSWTYECSLYWTPGQGNSGLVADLFLDICHSCCSTCPFHGVLSRESSLAF